MADIRDVRLGRLKLVTLGDDLKEAVGDTIETVGGYVAAGERRPRAVSLVLPIHGHYRDANPYNSAMKLRRQVRSLVDNARYRLQGLYLDFDHDPEINGWVVFGGGDVEYGEGGITLGEFRLALSDIYRVGQQRTHRQAHRIELYDRRLSTVPIDYKRTLYSVDFAALTPNPRLVWPPGAYGIFRHLPEQRSATPPVRAGLDGDAGVQSALSHGQIVSFELAEADIGKGDVQVYDRRGLFPATTLAGDLDPGVYGWEEVFGPNYPLSAADVPVLQNSFARVRYNSATSAFIIDRAGKGTQFAEQGRVTAFQDSPSGTLTQFYTLQSAEVVEYTPERAVVKAVFTNALAARGELYITLDRSSGGPKFELYAWSTVARTGCELRYTVNDPGTALAAFSAVFVIDSAHDAWPYALDGLPVSVVAEPFAYIEAATTAATIVPSRSGDLWHRYDDAVAYGSTRRALAFTNREDSANEGYVSMLVVPLRSVGLRREAEDATVTKAGATETNVADAAGSGGNAVNTTRAASAPTLSITAADHGLPLGRYRLYARVRSTVAAETISAAGGFGAVGATATTTAATFALLDLGEDTLAAGESIVLNVWRSAGATANARIDRIVAVPLERRTPVADQSDFYLGPRDVQQQALYDAQLVPELLKR